MYVSVSRLRIEPDLAPQLLEAFRSRAHLVDTADGFIDLQVWQAERDLGEIWMVSRWRDRDCFRSYMRSDSHAVSHARIPPLLKEAIKLERLDHMSGYEVVAE
ncbi:MAG TPA: antibiotic biosynthesis monooxygenase [Candidatus Limnocylindrales bacterium]|nr:antibiotic biosynthesis monooxygenase [Candidatus Limnocylindrales bacterium]